jgi:hypothetical protein
MIRVQTQGGDWADLSESVRAEMLDRAEVVVGRATAQLLDRVKANLSRVGGGEPSAPGEAPRSQSGALRRAFSGGKVIRRRSSVRSGLLAEASGRDRDDLWGQIGALEYGATRKGANGSYHTMPRPFIRPAEAVVEGELDRMMETIL